MKTFINRTVGHLLLASFLLGAVQAEQPLKSPDGRHELLLGERDGAMVLSYRHDGDLILKDSPIGLTVDAVPLVASASSAMVTTTVDETWRPVLGKNKTVRNHYVEYTVPLRRAGATADDGRLIIRCFDDGFAYRYQLDAQAGAASRTVEEQLQLNFAADFTYWAYNGERPNLGPLGTDAADILVRTPMVLRVRPDFYLALHEADIARQAPLTIQTKASVPTLSYQIEDVAGPGALTTSWRVFIAGRRPGDLVESNLLANLNEPSKLEDVSWVKPGKSVWDWRVWGYQASDGFEYKLDTPSHERLIDFASQNNIQYLLIDADWYGPEFKKDSDPTAARAGIDIRDTIAYAKARNVGVILYLNDVGAKKYGLERVLGQYAAWGAVGVKYGFMKGTWAEKVQHTRKVIELCAHYHLMVDFHDNPVPPSGEERTYPNVVAREFCHAQADAKRSYFPETAVSSAFINMIAGPLDYTNGWFDLDHAESRVRVFQPIPGTVVAEVAKLIVAYTGLMVLPDSPESYLAKSDLFECVRNMPAAFDSFKVLQGDIDSHIVVARAAGDDWFIGSLTNRDAREVEIDLSFLPAGRTYQATLYEDADDADYLTGKERYKIETRDVVSGARLKVKLAPGGGNVIHLKYDQKSS